MVKERFGVDEDDVHRRSRLYPSIRLPRRCRSSKPTIPLRDDPVAAIDNGLRRLRQLRRGRREAAVLCPSFYRTEIIYNPSRWDRRLAALRERVIGWLQRRREARRIAFA